MNKSELDPQLKDQEDSNARSNQRGRGKKRKRPASSSSTDEETVLPDNTLEVEKNLHASAMKNNLDDASVKKILKKVVTNDHVLALVKLREEEEDSSTEESLRPKLTRSKAKELMKASPKSVPWNLELTPIKHIPVKTRPEVKALIAQELPEDEDDDEYEPTNDDMPSDDEHMLESSSDVDSLPRTPGTPSTPRNQRRSSTPKVVNDGPFKVPQDLSTVPRRKLMLEEEEATIALRTRSKLSLSATSIEHIESSFVPPDELPSADVDSLWNDFLNDCLNPASNAKNEDDDETDPEYSVAGDPDADEEDEESLENSIIKISKKELNDLMTELFSIVPDGATEQLAENMMQEVLTEHSRPEQPPAWEGKQEPHSDKENNEELRRPSISMPAPITVKRDSTATISVEKSEPQDDLDIGNTEVNKQSSHYANTKENERIDSKENILETVQTKVVEDIREISKENELARQAKARASNPNVNDNTNKEKNDEEYPTVLRNVLTEISEPVLVEIPKKNVVLPDQRAILSQQLRQHVQLATGNFLQLYAHPEHWARAPPYKEYLMTLHKIGEKNPASVVNVCNLKPAVELITCWETTVSDNSPANIEMVEFVVQEVEKSRRRIAQNASYVGNFPEMYMKVVTNSNVFLYPYLLPPVPYRPDHTSRKFIYLRSEDELIALGVAQFWEYVLANPSMYNIPNRPHPRHRWGLSATTRLVSKYMLPFLTPKMLLSHIALCRKVGDETNPIVKFFKTMTVEPVKHTLLPFYPQRTLYDQLEMDMPRIWLRYLGKSTQIKKQLQKHLLKRKSDNLCKAPAGVDLSFATDSESIKKVPLSEDFTKEIISNRLNNLPPKTAPEQPAPKITILQPSVFTVIRTSVGSYLVPVQLQSTVTVNSNNTPICTPAATNSVSDKNTGNANVKSATEGNSGITVNKEANVQSSSHHCQCCVMLRKTRRIKQKSILDYFKSSKGSRKCNCNGKRYPKVTNRLKLLVKNFKANTQCIQDELSSRVETLEKERWRRSKPISDDELTSDDNEDIDFAVAILFQLKLTIRSAVARDNFLKRRIHTLFSKFDTIQGHVLDLAKEFEKICNVELVEIYREFIGFLTPEQADELGHFKDYFVQRCETKLIGKIEALVLDKRKRIELLKYVKLSFHTNYYLKWSSCEICTDLLNHMKQYPDLMEYVFSLFPHQSMSSPNQKESASYYCCPQTATQDNNDTSSLKEQESGTANGAIRECQESNVMDYEADHSSSDEENKTKDDTKNEEDYTQVPKDFELKQEIDLDVVNISIRKATSSDSSETSMVLMSDEDPLKTEAPDWKREEDKTILEILKQHITPEERKDITISEIMKDTPIIQMIVESLTHKSIDDIKERILYLLQLLVSSDNSVASSL